MFQKLNNLLAFFATYATNFVAAVFAYFTPTQTVGSILGDINVLIDRLSVAEEVATSRAKAELVFADEMYAAYVAAEDRADLAEAEAAHAARVADRLRTLTA